MCLRPSSIRSRGLLGSPLTRDESLLAAGQARPCSCPGKAKSRPGTHRRPKPGGMATAELSVTERQELEDLRARVAPWDADLGGSDTHTHTHTASLLAEKDEELGRLRRKAGRLGLTWDDKPEEIVEACRRGVPVLEEVPERAILAASDPAA